MPISINPYQTFRGFAIASEDVSYGDGDTQEVKVIQAGRMIGLKYVRRTCTVTLRGLKESEIASLEQEARSNRMSLMTTEVAGENLNFGGGVFKRALLLRVIVNGVATAIAGQRIVDSVQLEFESLTYA